MLDTVGVVVPTYNCSRYLADCLNSLLEQSCQPAQIVICDDGSRDGTLDVIKQYRDRHPDLIETVLHSKNLGIAKNFNSGLERIRTDLVSIIAGDDFWHPDKLKLEGDALRKNPECRWAYSDSVLTDECGNLIGPFRREYDGAEGHILFEILTHEMTLRNWLIEKSLLDEVGHFDEGLFIFEDWDFKIRLAAAAPVKHVDHSSVFYRRHEGGISSSSGRVYFECLLKIYQKQKKRIASLPIDKKQAIIEKQRNDMLLHLRRHLMSGKKVSTKDRLGYRIQQLKLNLMIR